MLDLPYGHYQRAMRNVNDYFVTSGGAGWRSLNKLPWSGARVFGRRDGPGFLACRVSRRASAWLWRLSWLVVTGVGLVVVAVAGQGGPAASPARVLRRRLRVFGGSAAAARRWVSYCRVFQAARMRWFRAASKVVTNSMRGTRPGVRLHHLGTERVPVAALVTPASRTHASSRRTE